MTDSVVAYSDDPEGYRLRLEAKLKPNRIRATLAFAGLYQMTHEMIKHAVIDEVASFHGRVELLDKSAEGRPVYDWIGDDSIYKSSVLALAPRNAFKASLLWLVDSQAIAQDQADRLGAIYDHRHALTHELSKYIVDVDFEPDLNLFIDATSILKDLRRFWAGIEKDSGSFAHLGEVDLDEVVPLSMLLLQMCVDAYVEGLEA